MERHWRNLGNSSKCDDDMLDNEVRQFHRLLEERNGDFGDTLFKVDILYFDGYIHIEEYLD